MIQSRRSPNVDQLLGQAMELGRAGRLDDARTLLGRVLAAMPRHAGAMQLMGLIERKAGRNERAVGWYERSLAIDGAQPHVNNNLGNVLLDLGRMDEAVGAYRMAIRQKPDYRDAQVNLAAALLACGEPQMAIAQLETARTSSSEDGRAWALLGRARTDAGETAGALLAFDRAAALGRNDALTCHAHALALRAAKQPEKALDRIDQAIAASTGPADHYLTRGHILQDLARFHAAADAYREAIRLDPLHRAAHAALDALLWQQGDQASWGTSYRAVLLTNPHADLLAADRAHALVLAGRSTEALPLIAPYAASSHHPEVHLRHGQALWSSAQPDKAIAAFDCGLAQAPENPALLREAARARIVVHRIAEATTLVDRRLSADPYDQQAIAYQALCWGLAGDSRADWLADHDLLVHEAILEPDGDDAADFYARLTRLLEGLHHARLHPLGQTLRGGTQTLGDLFDRDEPEIARLRGMILAAARDWIATLPDDSGHPFLSRKSGTLDFAGSWSVRLGRGGHHVQHLHPEGWISAALYVALPKLDGEQGWLTFGETPLYLGPREASKRRVQPQVGKLVLFPSYFYHGTLPFEADGTRLTVAFDLLPKP